MERKAEGSIRSRRARRKANSKARGQARAAARNPASVTEKVLAGGLMAEPLTLLSKVGRSGKVAGGLGILSILAFAGLTTLQKKRKLQEAREASVGLGGTGPGQTPQDIAGQRAALQGTHQEGLDDQSELAFLQTRGISPSRRPEAIARYKEKVFKSQLARMNRVSQNDPELFKQMAAMVVKSSRPRTTARTERIGPVATVDDLIKSGLFDGGPL